MAHISTLRFTRIYNYQKGYSIGDSLISGLEIPDCVSHLLAKTQNGLADIQLSL
ncbi:MAG: hypothetical protein A4E69_02934 [Syntrophus sp. PtaB.Bin138]|nr:MAG: hypothetical protein A4E69_02934 [Syntrophus sp. PtaB.Bin138]